MKIHFFFAAFTFAACTVLHAAADKKDPIDLVMDKAIEENPSTAGMMEAIERADEKWQKEIERCLAKLKKEMTHEQWKALQAAQQEWRVYREKEIQAQEAIYGAMQGTMWRPVAASHSMEINKARALLLRDYVETLSER